MNINDLITELVNYGKDKGADFMRTQVFPQNMRGMEFYERSLQTCSSSGG